MKAYLAIATLLGAAVALTACERPMFDCASDAVCDLVQQRYAIDDQAHIEGRQSRVFYHDGLRYELVHFEYGQGQDCPSGCFYSHLCTIVVNGDADYPAVFAFNSTEETLFDPLTYCPDWSEMGRWSNAECDMPAFDLPLMESSTFRSFILHPPDENDELRWCRNTLANYLTRPN